NLVQDQRGLVANAIRQFPERDLCKENHGGCNCLQNEELAEGNSCRGSYQQRDWGEKYQPVEQRCKIKRICFQFCVHFDSLLIIETWIARPHRTAFRISFFFCGCILSLYPG